ncbi:MAG: T9SS type A sorting domain-containing protein [Ignavibacteria bacterium]|nr:T9SS type A sorting domain-containing protein [Ignavibacteria bacterium]
MKNTKCVFLVWLFLLGTGLNAQQKDTIYTIVNGDSVTIYHQRVEKNCGSHIVMEYDKTDFTIRIGEVDTSTNRYFCNCTFDFSVTITGLFTGTYTANLLGIDALYNTSHYYGAVVFTIVEGGSGQILLHSPYQSQCYQPDEVKNEGSFSPKDYTLYPVYPNPFNPGTTISFSIPNTTVVDISVFDTNGKKIETLLNREMSIGNHRLIWSASKYSSGVYFISMRTGNVLATQPAILVK